MIERTRRELRERVDSSPCAFAFVIAPSRTLLGRLRRKALEVDPETSAQMVMEAGPSTVRADIPLDQLLPRMQKADVKTAVVTTPEGVLLGIVWRPDVEAALNER